MRCLQKKTPVPGCRVVFAGVLRQILKVHFDTDRQADCKQQRLLCSFQICSILLSIFFHEWYAVLKNAFGITFPVIS